MKRLRIFLTLLFTLCSVGLAVLYGSLAYAHGPSFAGEIDEFYSGVRMMGMGGTYVNVVNDETALLTNPAGLGKLRDLTFTIFDPEVHAGFTDTEIVTISNYAGALNVQGLLDILNTAKGKHWYAKYQVFPSIVGPNFGTGVLAKYQYNAEVNEAGTNFRFDYVSDLAMPLGYTFRFFSGVMKIGVVGRLMNRTEVHSDIDPTSTGLELKNISSEGIGIGADVGMILTAPVAWLPAIGGVVRDVGNTTYDLREGMLNATAARPLATEQTIDVSFSAQPIISNRIRATIALEYRGITTPLVEGQEDAIKRAHAGIEFNFADFAFLRGGANQGYWTAGLEFATERFQLQAATYGEEIGTPTTRREDRRWIGKFALRF